MSTTDATIRKAVMLDRQSIHNAHMRSIREICVKDHGQEEIKGWGYRELGDRWIEKIDNGLVWVVERQGEVQGLASIQFSDDGTSAHIQSLYLTPDVIGLGCGRKLMTIMLDEAKARQVTFVSLDSTITAHTFYKKFGFQDSGPPRKRPIGGAPVTSIPMKLAIETDAEKSSTVKSPDWYAKMHDGKS